MRRDGYYCAASDLEECGPLPFSTEVIEVDAPGISSPPLATFPYERLRHPLFPLEAQVEWLPSRLEPGT